MHPELAIGAFLASFLVLVPLPWHWRARNTATLSMLAWLWVSNLTYAINSIIWAGSVDIVVPVWCDIVTKSQIGATAALPACCLSLALQLWRVSHPSNTTSKRTSAIIDIVLCWGFPALLMILHYTFQGHRFDIIEDIGCRPTTYLSLPAVLMFYVPIALVVVLTFAFSSLAFSAFYQRRRTFTSFLQTKKSSFTARRYVRLMIITTVLALWEAAVIGLIFGITFTGGALRPYTSWADVHFDFSRIDQFPSAFIPRDVLAWTYVAWWTIPISGLSFFCSFGLGEDAAREYAPWWRWATRKANGSTTATTSTYGTDSVLDIKADFEGSSSDEDAEEMKIIDLNALGYHPPRRDSDASSSYV
ncbi:pheromone A receptor-domain-containing protein [Mycena filopes]|nr:pheromone A receptor-domain-containing protein [Mycena filopes]